MTTTDDLSPGTIELEAGMRPQRLWVLPKVAGIALALLLVFNSQGLVKWSKDLPSSAFNEKIAIGAVWWHDAMTALGPARAFAALHNAIGVELKP